VCVFENTSTKEKVAVKFNPTQGTMVVVDELMFLKEVKNKGLKRLPFLYDTDTSIDGRRFYVM
jgi:hypothetical protein